MKWFRKLERKYGKYAIRNLINYIVVLYIIGFVLNLLPIFQETGGVYYTYCSLDAEKIFQGQVWRFVTFLMDPPSTSVIFGALMIYLYFQIGQVLEQIWGSFRFNVYFFMGIIGNVLAAVLIYLITGESFTLGTTYINLSLFLAYALTFPDARFMLFFVIPIKAKYLAYADILLYVYMFIMGLLGQNWTVCIEITLSLLNFILFFFMTRNFSGGTQKVVKQRIRFQKQVREGQRRNSVHSCAVCGITDIDAPDMTFRYCSKCEGSYEYCSDHLYTHRHITKADMMNQTS